ncbi:uncharacterized protein [Prorops nasuta]|uniref:uncharacterized protein n=1 Tax=Prorops nasuta TaxID=863751 RepID=UPI0034CE1EED
MLVVRKSDAEKLLDSDRRMLKENLLRRQSVRYAPGNWENSSMHVECSSFSTNSEDDVTFSSSEGSSVLIIDEIQSGHFVDDSSGHFGDSDMEVIVDLEKGRIVDMSSDVEMYCSTPMTEAEAKERREEASKKSGENLTTSPLYCGTPRFWKEKAVRLANRYKPRRKLVFHTGEGSQEESHGKNDFLCMEVEIAALSDSQIYSDRAMRMGAELLLMFARGK